MRAGLLEIWTVGGDWGLQLNGEVCHQMYDDREITLLCPIQISIRITRIATIFGWVQMTRNVSNTSGGPFCHETEKKRAVIRGLNFFTTDKSINLFEETAKIRGSYAF